MPDGQATATKQKFTVNRGKDAVFESGGLRCFFEYRDLGIGKATGGKYFAHVIRAQRPCDKGTGSHYHELDFQMVYVLKGWVEFDYEGQGHVRLEAGDSVLQPPGIRHELTTCSDDLELIEITSPQDFRTVDA